MEKETRIVVQVEGMRCSMCEAHVNDAIRKVSGVKRVKASASKGEAHIIASSDIDLAAIKEAIAKEGYGVMGIESEPYQKKGFFTRLFY